MKWLLEGVSHSAVPLLFVAVFAIAAWRKVDVYASFVEGAKEGFETAVKIIPYLVGILCAISMVRTTGLIDAVAAVLGPITRPLGVPAEVMPMILIRPLSGSGANAVLVDLMKTHGPDAYVSRLAAVISSCAETTFYVLAVYFGSVGVTNIRYALAVGILGELVGVIISVVVCQVAFG
jgi:spore maturation protein B